MISKTRHHSLSFMDLTKYHKSTEFPMFCPPKIGSGGVENSLSPLVHLTTTSQTLENRAFQRLKKCQVCTKKYLFLMFSPSITVYIDTKKVIQTLMFTNRNWIFYFMTFLSIHYCIYRYKKLPSNHCKT